MSYKSVETSPDGRKVYRLLDLYPVISFPVEICDGDGNPLKEVTLGYSADGGEAREGDTDASGVLPVKCRRPPGSVSLSIP